MCMFRGLSTEVCERIINVSRAPVFIAGIAQLGEQQTEVLEVACSIHAPGITFCLPGRRDDPDLNQDSKTASREHPFTFANFKLRFRSLCRKHDVIAVATGRGVGMLQRHAQRLMPAGNPRRKF